MKNITKSAVLLSLLAMPLAAFAQTVVVQPIASSPEPIYRLPAVTAQDYEQAYMGSYDRNANFPFPIKVQTPNPNNKSLAGTNVEFSFTIDAQGVPHNIGVLSGTSDHGVATLLSNALSNWRFNSTGAPRQASLMMSIVEDRSGAIVPQYSLTSGGRTVAMK